MCIFYAIKTTGKKVTPPHPRGSTIYTTSPSNADSYSVYEVRDSSIIILPLKMRPPLGLETVSEKYPTTTTTQNKENAQLPMPQNSLYSFSFILIFYRLLDVYRRHTFYPAQR
jgi:hypothetical protein